MNNEDVHILLVDDEEEILEFLSYNLKKEGFKVHTAVNGKLAIEMAKYLVPDLIVLDMMMPEMDGIETCRCLRKINDLDNSIITFLSARSEDYAKIEGLDVGADDYIVKPIKPLVFVAKIKSLLRRANRFEKKSKRIVINNLRVNLEKRKVKRKGEAIDLTKIEYKLLILFLHHPDKVFTREEIYEKIWGSQIIVGDRTLDVHVRNLRKKIGEDNIKTIKGIGYAFNGWVDG